jgi:histidine ammonia-lyase
MIAIDGASLSLDQIAAVAAGQGPVGLTDEARRRVEAARAVVDGRAAGDQPIYGVNTGFGSFADVRIDRDALDTLQLNLLRSHAAGVGDPLPVPAVRATMLLRANVLARGHSGIRLATIESLIALLNANVHPRVPSRGSVGASGDLAPLAHLVSVMVSHERAEAIHAGRRMPAREAFTAAGLEPDFALKPKDVIAMINGSTISLAIILCDLLKRSS